MAIAVLGITFLIGTCFLVGRAYRFGLAAGIKRGFVLRALPDHPNWIH